MYVTSLTAPNLKFSITGWSFQSFNIHPQTFKLLRVGLFKFLPTPQAKNLVQMPPPPPSTIFLLNYSLCDQQMLYNLAKFLVLLGRFHVVVLAESGKEI